MTRIFISHSHSDEAIAYKLVSFLLASLKLEEDEILCSSNPDQGLFFTFSSIADQLKQQLKDSEALIVLITADSLHSAWIPFEAGSFWTTDKPIVPILGPGLTHNDLRGPLRGLLSISIEAPNSEDKLNNAINQLASKLKIESRSTKRRNNTLKDFSETFKDWKSQRPDPEKLQQQQIEELNKTIEELKRSQGNELKQIEIAHQQEKQQLEQSFESRINKLGQEQELMAVVEKSGLF